VAEILINDNGWSGARSPLLLVAHARRRRKKRRNDPQRKERTTNEHEKKAKFSPVSFVIDDE
jgi:hypothetical protein